MKISKKLYIDDHVSYQRWILWKLRKNKKIKNVYCIIYTEDQFLEIISSHKIKDKHKECTLIGLAYTKERAIELVARIFDEVYKPNPNIQDMKDYFTQNNS